MDILEKYKIKNTKLKIHGQYFTMLFQIESQWFSLLITKNEGKVIPFSISHDNRINECPVCGRIINFLTHTKESCTPLNEEIKEIYEFIKMQPNIRLRWLKFDKLN